MRTFGSKATRVTRKLRRRGLPLALLAVGMVVLQASECSKEDFYDALADISLLTGSISGTLTLDGDPVSGTTVTVRQGGSVVDTETTDGDGFYRIPALNPGTYMASAMITGAICPEQTALVEEDEETVVNIPCTTPEPQTGTVTGTVTVNGTGESGVAVTLRDGTTVIGTTTTGTGGTYSFTDVPAGTRNASIETPEGATCETTQQDVTVPAGGTATANFPCTRPSGDFIVVFTQIVTDHRGQTSVICWVTTTTPAQPGATFQVVTTGPGVLTPAVSGALNANGQAAVEVGINLFGTYNIGQIVTFGANEASALTMHTVDQTEGVCPVAQSSLRFKRGVTALLPDDVRPLGLRPVAFRYREPWGDPAEPQIGLIAEEVAEVYPEAVYLDAEGRPEAIDYPGLTKAVVVELESRVAAEVRRVIARLAF